MDRLKALQYFVSVVETGGFSAAAKHFNVPPSSISRRISDLEADLKVELLKRTTRTIALTEVGEIYFKEVKAILQQLLQSDEAVRAFKKAPVGRLKINSMVGFGERVLFPLLDEFSECFPDVTLDLVLSDEVSKLSRDDVDIAIRGGFAPDERVVAVKLMENQFIPCAAPGYLQQYGVPISTVELLKHRGLFFKTPMGPTPWLSEIEGQWQEVSGTPVLISNSGKWLVKKAVEGKGILMIPRWVIQSHLDCGELVQLKFEQPLDITQSDQFGVYMLYQKSAYHLPKIKAAVDFITAKVRQ